MIIIKCHLIKTNYKTVGEKKSEPFNIFFPFPLSEDFLYVSSCEK